MLCVSEDATRTLYAEAAPVEFRLSRTPQCSQQIAYNNGSVRPHLSRFWSFDRIRQVAPMFTSYIIRCPLGPR